MEKTSTGFKYKIDERVKTDWEFVKTYQQLQRDPSNIEIMEKLFCLLLTDKGFENLKKHIAKLNGGFLPMEALVNEFKEIIRNNTVKN